MTSRAWIYAGLLVAAGVGLASASKAPAPRAVPGNARILLIGDSLSVGLKTPMALLAKETNIPFAHCGAQGYTINRFVGNGTMAGCVAQQLTSLKPTHVLILLGTNDEAMSASMAPQQLEAARSLVATCQAHGAEVIWIAPAKKFTTSNGVLSGLRKMFDDAHWFESSSIGLPTADSIGHMTPVNYCKWSGSIWNWLTRIAVSPSRC
jgi:lysophospholipase L1-like esterase